LNKVQLHQLHYSLLIFILSLILFISNFVSSLSSGIAALLLWARPLSVGWGWVLWQFGRPSSLYWQSFANKATTAAQIAQHGAHTMKKGWKEGVGCMCRFVSVAFCWLGPHLLRLIAFWTAVVALLAKLCQ
jgi:hypothetical protein